MSQQQVDAYEVGYVALSEQLEGNKKPKPREQFNYNVVLTLLLVGVSGCADSIWSGTVLAAYLYILTDDSNKRVGYVEAAQGLATLITALPVRFSIQPLRNFPQIECCFVRSFCLFFRSVGQSVLHQQKARVDGRKVIMFPLTLLLYDCHHQHGDRLGTSLTSTVARRQRHWVEQ